jgi:SAM-dependent methyltransferase
MPDDKTDLLRDVANYYSDKLAKHGETPRGVDWNSEESQLIRFEQLCKVITSTGAFSLHDVGCGYGALYDFLAKRHQAFSYLGLDISQDMIRACERRYSSDSRPRFIRAFQPNSVADYGIASGLFNVRLDRSDIEWLDYIEATLNVLDQTSRKGFGFNCLTSYADKDRMQDYLFYANPCLIFDLCKRRYSRQVALLHDYGLYEFTILVRKV